jgi:hypothetical protein
MNFRVFLQACHEYGRLFRLMTACSLLLVLGLVIIGFGNNLSDRYDTSFAVLQPSYFASGPDGFTSLQLTDESITLPLVNKNSLLIRAPPLFSVRPA